MKRSRATSFSAPQPIEVQIPGPETPVEPMAVQPPIWRETAGIVAALLAVLDAIEVSPRSGPAVRAYQSAVRRQGEAAAEIGGSEAMETVLRQVADADPSRASARTVIVRAAWSDLLRGDARAAF